MLHTKGVTHFAIPVTDLNLAEAFYRDFLGLEFLGYISDGKAACLRAGTADLVLCETGQPLDPSLDAGGIHYAFTVSPEVFEEAVREIAAQDMTIDGRAAARHGLAGPIVYRERGVFPGRQLFLLDPSGNRIELCDPSWKAGMPTPTFDEIAASH